MTRFRLSIKRLQKENGLFDIEILFTDGTKTIISDCKPIANSLENELEEETYSVKQTFDIGEIKVTGKVE